MKRLLQTLLLALAIGAPVVPLLAGSGDCCWDLCKGGPLCCGKLTVLARGGVTPTGFTHQGRVWVTAPTNSPVVFSPISTPSFGRLFSVPWNVGAEVAWNASCRIQYFLEYAYTRGDGSHRVFRTTVGDSAPIVVSIAGGFSAYSVNAGYLGSRYFFEGCCLPCIGKIAPYVGFKAGFAVQKSVIYSVDGLPVSVTFFKHQTSPSAGLQLGLEWWFYQCWSLVLQGEVIGTCGLRPNRNIETGTALVTNVNVGETGWILSWPVTLGVRFAF